MLHLFLFLTFFSVILSTDLSAQTTENQAEAMRLAKENNKNILLLFAGSDWCVHCIRFDKNVLQNADFLAYSENNLVVLKCDFPQRKKQDKATIQQNELLAEQYNPQGEFPTLLLMDCNMNKIAPIQYQNPSAAEFIKEIKKIAPSKKQEYHKQVPMMGSFFEFVLVADSKEEAVTWKHIEDCIAEAQRIENLISEWIPSSEISQINQHAGENPTTVSEEVYKLLQRSIAISTLTQGAFDLTFLPYYDYWKFDKTQTFPFDTLQIKKLGQFVGYQNIELLPNSQVFLPKGFKMGLGGIGQGYAVDKIKELLLKRGINDFVVNSSGDIYAHGNRADGTPWKIGIASPLDRDKIVKWLPVSNFAVVTSGTSEKNFEYNGQIYSHIINPKTGFPVEGLQSVTVMSEFTEVADALATSILILGKEIGLDLINQLPQTHCIIIDNQQNIYYSDGLDIKD